VRKKLLFLFSLPFLVCQAQPGKEAWHWVFGSHCVLDFSSGSPVPAIAPFTIGTAEGCASVSDIGTGQYLFSVLAATASNKNLAFMQNGQNLKAGTYCTQADLIVPLPGSNHIYYVITNVDMFSSTYGIHYSIVDMNLQNGLGAVITKNVYLMSPPNTDKLTAVRHCNGTDYWIITHPFNSNSFYVYLLTASGINPTPVVSSVGTVQSGNTADGVSGYLKASPNGKKLALGVNDVNDPLLEMFDFDNSTGNVSNPITVTYPGIYGPYGVSFSPDNSKLYAAPYNQVKDTSYLYQFDMSSGIPTAIIASQTLITAQKGTIGAMQMAPNGKIYVAQGIGTALAAINNPNIAGMACGYQAMAVALMPGSMTAWGLPNFIDANYAGIQLNLQDIKQCSSFQPDTLDAGTGFTSYYWNTGANTQTIVVNNPGTYWVTVTNAQGCIHTDTVHAYLLSGGTKKNVSSCVIDTLNTAQSIVLAYHWSDGTMSPVKTFTASGIYYEDVSFIGGCSIRDTFNVTINPNPQTNLGRDTAFCKGDLKLDAYYPNATYQWSTGETSSSIEATNPGKYFVTVTSQYGCKGSDTLMVNAQPGAFDFQMPNIVTPNGDNINDEIDFSKLQFSELQIQIYNRWGQEIFESQDANAIWRPAGDDGTYFFTANYRIDCGAESQSKNIKGFITVIR
jgi:gliding motility-associated-like protein